MPFFRPPSGSRTTVRAAAAVSCAALLAASVSACSSAERLTTGMKVRNAVVKLGDQPAATVIASVDGSPRQAREFLAQVGNGKGDGDGKGDADDGDSTDKALDKAALRLARAEVTLSAGTGDEEEKTPLKELPKSDAANVAAAVNFGGKDVAAVKSVDDRLYLRADLEDLVEQTEGSKRARRAVSEIVALADDLPGSLRAARDALKGKWVRADPETFDDFARAAETLAERQQRKHHEDEAEADGGKHGDGDGDGDGNGDAASEEHEESEQARRSREIRDAVTVGSALNGQSQREFISGVQELLREHAEFDARGERGGAEHVRLTLPGKKAAKDLVAALRPLGAEIAPRRVPQGDIVADLSIRRGQLTSLTLDLGQFTGGGAHLPLRLEFSGGDAVAVTAPGGTEELQPQDLVAALMYGALGTERF
ncbi:hypothetical protein [Streptomyces nanshensis]|uniref:Aromatic ring-opening dioxygenase LigA n=1 Tax=Streptomyces nanshensis TaxID=518642 RepID=A0A1E7L2B2_9ACTN|nr:hypothetical protein [Streptomyces nanshensis]OEV10334.1 hypothetical protein AN218_18050 [Streptomyces nanshensis]